MGEELEDSAGRKERSEWTVVQDTEYGGRRTEQQRVVGGRQRTAGYD